MTLDGIMPTPPTIAREIDPGELARLLGLPRGAIADAGVPGVEAALTWYVDHGDPWGGSRTLEIERVDSGEITLAGGGTLLSPALAERLGHAEADRLVVVIVSAGPGVGEEARRRWDLGRPEESFALDRLGAAVTEHLLARSSAALCQAAEPHGRFVLPGSSPGYDDWDMSEQVRLFGLLPMELRGPIDVLASGMLRPVASQLAVFGVARGEPSATRPAVPCASCSFSPCSYRRTVFRPGSDATRLSRNE